VRKEIDKTGAGGHPLNREKVTATYEYTTGRAISFGVRFSAL
jgi:hypothetical protein